MGKLKFGWAEVDITPKKGQKIGLAGQFFERIGQFSWMKIPVLCGILVSVVYQKL